MNEEAWKVIEDIIEATTIRFKEFDVEIEKLKFRVRQLEEQEDGSKRSE